MGARLLRSEADNLNARVATTEVRMSNLENNAKKDDDLTKEAKDKVGQANADAAEAQKQVEKALREVNLITEELASLRNIDVEDLNRLGMIYTSYFCLNFNIFSFQNNNSPLPKKSFEAQTWMPD